MVRERCMNGAALRRSFVEHNLAGSAVSITPKQSRRRSNHGEQHVVRFDRRANGYRAQGKVC